MNSWKTDLIVVPSGHQIRTTDKIITIGSCFADVIGNYLSHNKFQCVVNPFGIVYNPISIHQLLKALIDIRIPLPKDFVQREDMFYHYQFHSSITEPSQALVEKRIQNILSELHAKFLECDYLIITYGTAFAYELKDNGITVANCHKMPADLFNKRLLTVEMITKSFQETLQILKQINPALKVILTVSPVRHLKDSLELNSVSKSILRVACQQLKSTEVTYFPALEIMIDDLRDYRFYKKDRIHPTEEAEEYILEKFEDQYFNNDTRSLLLEWKSLRQALSHRAINSSSTSHQKFLRNTFDRLIRLNEKLNMQSEIHLVERQLAATLS